MPETKAALIVANWRYEDADLRQLVAPANDAEALAAVLRDPKICGFEVTTLLNRPSREACEQIERFFLDRKRDDLLLLYFSCHGIKDDDGLLYFAAPDTRLVEHSRPLRSTALSADFVRSVMRASNSRRQVLMLDCCYSGAFAGAMLSKGDKSSAGVRDQFDQGRGMVVMTASDALQYSFEGDSVSGEAVNSIFTRVLVEGIKTGEADRDCDGTISLEELYLYVYDRVTRENPNQRPKRWDLGVEGQIVFAQTPVVRAAELAPDLVAAMGSPLSRVRVGAVGELSDLLNGGHKGLAEAARQALEKLAGDDSRQVSAAAEAALGRGTAVQPEALAREPLLPHRESRRLNVPVQRANALSPETRPAAADDADEYPSLFIPGHEVKRQVERDQKFWIITILVLFAGFLLYKGWTWVHTRSRQPAQTISTESKAPAPVTPVVLPRPPFDYYSAIPQASDTNVRLTQVSSKPNQITDEEEWFKSNDLVLPTLTVPNAFKEEAGNLPPQVPPTLGKDKIIEAIKQDDDVLCIYGPNYGTGRYLTSVNLSSGRVNFAFDFHEFMHPPKYEEADREYVDETLHWAQVKDDVLYVSTGHDTYARSSFGQNSYLNAIEIPTGRLLWRSRPLVSNTANFLLYGDAILTGYGFTQEQHFLYVVNQKDGRIAQTVPVRKAAEYILNKGDNIYVRLYDTDMVFKASGK